LRTNYVQRFQAVISSRQENNRVRKETRWTRKLVNISALLTGLHCGRMPLRGSPGEKGRDFSKKEVKKGNRTLGE